MSPQGLIGCDLEYAVEISKGEYAPAGILPISGTKGNPEPMPTGGLEIDCCAVELTMPPASSENQFVSNILNHLEAVRSRFPRVQLVTKASVVFDKKVLRDTPQATTMGCSPDFNVWTGRMNKRPRSKGGLRTFGGHVHIEHGTEATIMACDLTLGMWSVLVDKDTERRKLYGRAGAFRPKPYGVEYRVLSNVWCDKEDLIRKVYQLTQKAKELSSKIEGLVSACGGAENIQAIINNSQVDDAKLILRGLDIQWN